MNFTELKEYLGLFRDCVIIIAALIFPFIVRLYKQQINVQKSKIEYLEATQHDKSLSKIKAIKELNNYEKEEMIKLFVSLVNYKLNSLKNDFDNEIIYILRDCLVREIYDNIIYDRIERKLDDIFAEITYSIESVKKDIIENIEDYNSKIIKFGDKIYGN